jgi:DNA/RNA-binding protein KIN17
MFPIFCFRYITWIDREPETLAREEALAKRDKMSKDDDERMAEFVSKQVERERDKIKEKSSAADPDTCHQDNAAQGSYTDLQRVTEDEKIILDGLRLDQKPNLPLISPTTTSTNYSVKMQTAKKSCSSEKTVKKNVSSIKHIRKKSSIELIIEEEEAEKARKASKNREKSEMAWLKIGIIVKITSKNLGEIFYKQKGEILQVEHKFKALLKLTNETQTKVTVDQSDLETVIPAEGRKVLILAGKYRGEIAILKNLNVDKFAANLVLQDDTDLKLSLPYEHFSKVSS